MNTCPMCQHENSIEATVCSICGHKLTAVPGKPIETRSVQFERLAEEMGREEIDSLGEHAIDIPYRNWVVSFRPEHASVRGGGTDIIHLPGSARIVAEYITKDGFTFEVRRRGFVRRLFNRGAIQVGDAEINREFAITGSDEEKVKRLFANVKIRDLLRAQPSIRLRVKGPQYFFGLLKLHPVAGEVVTLHFEEGRAIRDAERLRGLFQLFKEILDQLVVIGSASEDNPGMREYHDDVGRHADDADAYFRRGAAGQGFGQSDRAMRDFNTALRLSPDHADAYFHRGLLYSDMGQDAQAIEDFSKAISSDSDYVEAYIQRAAAYYNLGEFQDAVSDYDAVIEQLPANADAYFGRAVAHARLGRRREAENDFEKAAGLGLSADLKRVFEAIDPGD